MATDIFPYEDESGGISQVITPDDLRPKPTNAPAPPAVDVTSLAIAIRASIEFERPTNFESVTFLDTLTTVLTTYQKVGEWIPRAPGGVLKEISITNDPNAQYRLVVSSREMFKDKILTAPLTIDYQRMRVPGGNDKNITVYAKSTGPSITVQSLINGEQVLP